MSKLIVEPNIAQPDDVYQWLVDLHAGRDEDESLRINARLILLLLNHVGDCSVVREAMELAQSAGMGRGPGT